MSLNPKTTTRLEQEARDRGLVLLGRALHHDTNYRHYQIQACGHTQDITTANVRRGHGPYTGCKQCLQNKLENEAASAGIRLIGPAQGAHKHIAYRLYELACGHQSILDVSAVRQNAQGGFRCKTCSEQKYSSEAVRAGLVLLTKPPDNGLTTHRRYLFQCCGKEADVHTYAVRTNGFSCPNCAPTLSNGEMTIRNYLTRLGIEFQHQYRVSVSNRPRRFDFLIPNTSTIIEYDGEDHFFSRRGFLDSEQDRLETWLNTSGRDTEKSLWCVHNDFRLVRIHYRVNKAGKLIEAIDKALAEKEAGPFMLAMRGGELVKIDLAQFLFDEGLRYIRRAGADDW